MRPSGRIRNSGRRCLCCVFRPRLSSPLCDVPGRPTAPGQVSARGRGAGPGSSPGLIPAGGVAGLRRTHPGQPAGNPGGVLPVPSPRPRLGAGVARVGRAARRLVAAGWGWVFAVGAPGWAVGVWCWLSVGCWSGVPVCRFAGAGCRRAAWRGCPGGRVVRRVRWSRRGRWVRRVWVSCPGVAQ